MSHLNGSFGISPLPQTHMENKKNNRQIIYTWPITCAIVDYQGVRKPPKHSTDSTMIGWRWNNFILSRRVQTRHLHSQFKGNLPKLHLHLHDPSAIAVVPFCYLLLAVKKKTGRPNLIRLGQ